MYEALAYLKPGPAFSLDELERVVRDVARSGEAEVSRSGRTVRLELGGAVMEITENCEPEDLAVCRGIAERYSVPCDGCTACFAFFAEDPEMELFNDYLLVLERLHRTGRFVVFDYTQGEQLFADPRGW
jgi:hypothetical protein